MKIFSIKKRECLVWTVLPFFLFSFFSFAVPVEAFSPHLASPASGEGINAEPNPLATAVGDFYIPPNAIRVGGRTSQVYLDPVNTERIYLLSETLPGGILTLRYIYNDILGTVTLLSSFTKKNKDPRFAHYYRYAQGAHSSLELILDEGWVKGANLIPSKSYDYYRGVVSVRTLDRAGNILKLESSAGVTRHFIYSRSGRLLTIEEKSVSGGASFYDQAVNSKDWDLPPMNVNESRRLFTMPDRGKDKLYMAAGHPLERVSLPDPLLRGDDKQNEHRHFLIWLESAHPLRAGPAGGITL